MECDRYGVMSPERMKESIFVLSCFWADVLEETEYVDANDAFFPRIFSTLHISPFLFFRGEQALSSVRGISPYVLFFLSVSFHSSRFSS